MTKKQHLARPALTAIAALLAATSTQAFAQEATPATDAPIETSVAPTSEPVVSPPVETTAATPDELAPVDTTPAARKAVTKTQPARSTSSPSSMRPAPAVPVRSTADQGAILPPTAATTATPAVSDDSLAAAPMTPDVAEAQPSKEVSVSNDDILPIAGAAGLGVLALGGLGMAMRRRRRKTDDVALRNDWHEPVVRPAAERSGTPAIVTSPVTERSAFAWGNPASATNVAPAVVDSRNRMEAAYRGPTPDNPFLSLKKRLRRAAFFDQRERAVRAGKAAPVSPMAGLPKAMAEKVRASMTSNVNRTFQPA